MLNYFIPVFELGVKDVPFISTLLGSSATLEFHGPLGYNGEALSSTNPHRDMIATVALAAAWADGSVCVREKQALTRVMLHLGYESDEISQRLAQSDERVDLSAMEIPESPAVRLDMMRYALALTLADGALIQDEVHFLVALTKQLSISPHILAILRDEAEHLVGEVSLPDGASIVARVEALLPPAV